MVRVRTTTDFAARGEGVGAFAKRAAMLAYACKATDWSGLAEAWPEMEDARNDLARGLGEGVEIDAIFCL